MGTEKWVRKLKMVHREARYNMVVDMGPKEPWGPMGTFEGHTLAGIPILAFSTLFARNRNYAVSGYQSESNV